MDAESIYLTFEQALDAEIKHMLEETEFQNALAKYNEMVSSGDIKADIRNAADEVRLHYVGYQGTDTIGERQENGVRWYEARIQSWTNQSI